MAERYTRRINLYINDKEVRNDIASIRKEMTKMVAAQNRMIIGSREYVAEGKKIAALRAIIRKHNEDLQQTSKSVFSLGKIADAANRYFSLITAAVAGFTGAAIVVKSTVDAFAEFDDKLVDVMKTTDLSKKQVKELNKELGKIDTRTAQIDLLNLARIAGKLGIRGAEDVLGFVRATDKIVVALSEDLGGDAEESVRQIGKLVDIFKLTNDFTMEESLLKIGSAMNALGASGTANEAYLLEFTKRVAGVAPTANITIDKVLGIATTLDELGQSSEVAATAYNQVISKMFKDTETYANIAGISLEDFTNLMNTDTNEAFIKLLEGAKGSSGGFGELTNSLSELGMDGVRATTVLGVLAANIDKLRENQKFSNEEFIKGDSLLIEFNKKNESAQAKLEKAAKRFKEIQVELGEKLTPIYAGTIHKASTLLKVFGATVEFLFKYGGAILFATGYLLTYVAAVKLAALWETRKNAQVGLGLALQYLSTAAYHLQFAAIALYNAGVALLTGNLKKAAISARLFMASISATPIGLAFVAVAALIGAIRAYDTYSAAARDREQERIRSLRDLKIITEAYSGHVDTLSKSIQNLSTQTRQQKNETAEMADEMVSAAKAQLYIMKANQMALRESHSKATLWQKTINLIKAGGNAYVAASMDIVDGAKNGSEAAALMDDGINQLAGSLDQLKSKSKDLNEILFAESAADKIGTESIVMMQEKLAKYKVALDNAIFGGEEYIRIQKKIQAVEKKMGTAPKLSSDEQITKEIDILEAGFNKKQAVIRQNFLEGKITQDEYNSQLLVSELKFFDDKLKIYNAGSKEYQETVNKSLEIQAAAKQKLDDLALKALEVLRDAEIANLKDGLEKELALQNQAWEKEKAGLEKQIIDKQILTQQEFEFNDSIYRTIEEKERLHQQKMADIKNASKIGELENLVEAAEPLDDDLAEFEQIQSFFDAKQNLIQAQYEREQELANGNHSALLAAEARFNKASLANKKTLIDAEFDISLQKIATAQGYLSALSGLFEQESAMGKALFLFTQGLAIADIWVNVARANAAAMAALVLPPLYAPVMAANTALGGVNTALVLAQTIGHFAKFATGGYTNGERIYIAGEKGTEWIAPNWMMENPSTAAVIQNLEKMRKNKVNINSEAIPQMASGGFIGNTHNIYNSPDSLNNNNIEIQNQVLKDLTNEINLLRKYRPTVAVETIEKERNKYIEILQTSGI